MKILTALFLSALAAGAAAPAEIDALAAAARQVPPEFAADSLLRLAALDAVDPARKLELIRQAFEKGAQAQQPYKRLSILNPGQVSPFPNRAYRQDLDGLSLQLRAVDLMLAADPAEARALFLRIPPLRLAPLQCSDTLAFDVDHFYRTLAGLAAQSFTDGEKAEGEPLRFLTRYAGAITSPVQAGPMAGAIAGQDGNDTDFQALVALYARALGKIHGDDRSFTFAQKLGESIDLLAGHCDRRKISPLPLLESYRLYLVVHLSASRCADDDRVAGSAPVLGLVSGAQAGQPVVSMVDFFNRQLRRDPLQPVQEIESTPSRLEGVAAVARTCQDSACKAVMARYRELIIGPGGQAIRPADRAAREWHSSLETILADLKQWTAGSSAKADVFRDKAALYNDLLNLAPAGSSREAVLRGELEFLLQGRDQAASRMEWFLPLNALLARTALDPGGFGEFAAELRKSSEPVVALYARLEALAPRPADRLIGLL